MRYFMQNIDRIKQHDYDPSEVTLLTLSKFNFKFTLSTTSVCCNCKVTFSVENSVTFISGVREQLQRRAIAYSNQ